MRFPLPGFLALLVNVLLTASAATAENADAELSTTAQIRQIYDEMAADWPEIPNAVFLAVRHAEYVNYFEYPTQDSPFAIYLGQQFSPENSQSIRNPSTPMSAVMGEALSHDEVLNWFVNEVALGQGCRGIPDAGMAYFGKSVDELTLEEIAYLAAIRKAPNVFHPVTSYDQRAQTGRRGPACDQPYQATLRIEDERSALQWAYLHGHDGAP